ncbi:MAG TPA: hypothetical protein PKW35_15130, partial [Nannocystaceae bacterium]|nr:hypothetical protein [Nannocystaceae bacterium]
RGDGGDASATLMITSAIAASTLTTGASSVGTSTSAASDGSEGSSTRGGGSGETSSGGASSEGTSGSTGGSGSSGDTGDTGDTGGTPSLCEPAGNLIEHGSLDEGMNGAAPAGWEVRSPGKDQECAGNDPHVFASAAAPGCGGGGITVDANDAWDCYAVQTVSPYNSIEGGATYVIRATVRSSGNAVNPAAWFVLGVQWLDGNDAFFGDEKNPKPAAAADNDFDWKVLEWEVQAPPEARRILVWMTAHYPGQVEYDHVAVVKK